MQQRERELVDAHVVVFPESTRRLQRALVALLADDGLGVVRDAPVVLHLVGHAETFALPFARLRKEALPRDRPVVLPVEAQARQPFAHALAQLATTASVSCARPARSDR